MSAAGGVMKNPILDHLPDFTDALEEQLEEDYKRWGDTWKSRPREGQEERIFARFDAYRDQFVHGGTPIPWLKIAGLAFIAWYRETQGR